MLLFHGIEPGDGSHEFFRGVDGSVDVPFGFVDEFLFFEFLVFKVVDLFVGVVFVGGFVEEKEDALLD